MAYSSHSQRSSSPFRHSRSPPIDANIPGLPHVLAPASSLSTQFSKSTRCTAASPALPSSIHKFKFGSPSFPSPTSVFGRAVSPTMDRTEFQPITKENVLVTVRFRPLSLREIHKGDEVAWFADGNTTVRSEYNPATAYSFDRVFGPATTTRCVYDVAAQQVVRGVMEGINGTVFAYGVTSSGKTHTMHGDHKSPGIIPMAVKDVFNIIQDTPGREYLLRVSYLEIYNEVINDLLDPAGQNLRIREDSLGTYVEGIKEELVLSPAHALSLITAGEEHRHVGSNNFNLLSSRSHTIFTLTVESSLQTADHYDNEVTLSQLNLIDLAGSESSKTETTGLRRKEGSYINKSLLTLGTVIAKLSDGRALHVPYRDSKLTRLLQFSLSGHARVSLICTLTPASSNIEETHNTLKFAHRAKHVAIHAAPNRIMDEKSLIKKYQREIMSLKQELSQLKRGVFDKPYLIGMSQEDLLSLRQQFEAGQVKLQSRLEEEEQAKAALLGRIQRLTKLILVSTKSSVLTQGPGQQPHRRRHSFGEEHSKYLGEKKDGCVMDFNDDSCLDGHKLELNTEGNVSINGIKEINKNEKKSKRWGMLGWFKLWENENKHLSPIDAETSPNLFRAQLKPSVDSKGRCWRSSSLKNDELTQVMHSFPELTQAGELFSATGHGRRPPPTGQTMADQMDLLREQVKLLSGEVALCTSSLKRMSEQASSNPGDVELQAQMEKIKKEIQEKNLQIEILEHRIIGTGQATLNNASHVEMSETISKLMGQLSEKDFELEIKSADNRILQDQLQIKISEIQRLQDMIVSMQQQSTTRAEKKPGNWRKASAQSRILHKRNSFMNNSPQINRKFLSPAGSSGDFQCEETEANGSDSESCSSKGSSKNFVCDSILQSKMLMQVAEIENLMQEKVHLLEENGGLKIQTQKLEEEASYAKELASAAAVELKNLAEEVAKLSSQNAKLANDLTTAHEAALSRAPDKSSTTNGYMKNVACIENHWTNSQTAMVNHTENSQLNKCFETENEVYDDIDSWKLDPEDMKRELHARMEREAALKASLAEKEQSEIELREKLEEAKKREVQLENDLTGMWVLVAKLQKERMTYDGSIKTVHNSSVTESLGNKINFLGVHEKSSEVQGERKPDEGQTVIGVQASLEEERLRNVQLKILVS